MDLKINNINDFVESTFNNMKDFLDYLENGDDISFFKYTIMKHEILLSNMGERMMDTLLRYRNAIELSKVDESIGHPKLSYKGEEISKENAYILLEKYKTYIDQYEFA